MKFNFLKKNSKLKSVNFFDLSSSVKKKVIKKAVKESTEEQVKLLRQYGYAFNLNKKV